MSPSVRPVTRVPRTRGGSVEPLAGDGLDEDEGEGIIAG